MPKKNREISDKLSEIADLLEYLGEDQYRVRSYRTASLQLSERAGDVQEYMKEGKELEDIQKIGEKMADLIREYLKSGKIEMLEDLRKKVPKEIRQMMAMENVGPVRARRVKDELGVDSIRDLKKAAREGDLDKVEGFGEKTVEGILQSK